MRTYWLSFADDNGNLGVTIVDVLPHEVQEVIAHFPILSERDEDAQWGAAAIRVAHRRGVNPGGEVAYVRLDDLPGFKQEISKYKKFHLMTKDEAEAIAPLERVH